MQANVCVLDDVDSWIAIKDFVCFAFCLRRLKEYIAKNRFFLIVLIRTKIGFCKGDIVPKKYLHS